MEKKYCAFIDVLGYGSIVSDPSRTQQEKMLILKSIYENLASHLQITIKEINELAIDKIFIKSFSDCFYLESSNPIDLLHSVKQVFKETFGFYSNITDSSEYTPLIRCGIVKDWTLHFNDLAAIVNNETGTNPVGLGVARAYWTSENTNLSGMRIIVSPEVINDLTLKSYSRNGYDCLSYEYQYNNIQLHMFFEQIKKNEKECDVDLYEMIWPEEEMSSCTCDFIFQLKSLKTNFNNKSFRHFQKTAEVILKGLLLTNCDERTSAMFEEYKAELETMIKQA